jgi:hypothetical protein
LQKIFEEMFFLRSNHMIELIFLFIGGLERERISSPKVLSFTTASTRQMLELRRPVMTVRWRAGAGMSQVE